MLSSVSAITEDYLGGAGSNEMFQGFGNGYMSVAGVPWHGARGRTLRTGLMKPVALMSK